LRAMKVSLTAPNRTAVYFENTLLSAQAPSADGDQGLRT